MFLGPSTALSSGTAFLTGTLPVAIPKSDTLVSKTEEDRI